MFPYNVVLGYCRKAFRGWKDRDELIAEAVAVAFILWTTAKRKVTGCNVAHFAVRRVRVGRLAGGTIPKREAMRLTREERSMYDFADDMMPAEVAQVRMDFGDYLKTLPKKKRIACGMFIVGERTRDVAKRLDVSWGRASQLRRELVEGYLQYSEGGCNGSVS